MFTEKDKKIKDIENLDVENCPEIVLINFLLHNYPNLKKYLFFNNQIRGDSKELINQLVCHRESKF